MSMTDYCPACGSPRIGLGFRPCMCGHDPMEQADEWRKHHEAYVLAHNQAMENGARANVYRQALDLLLNTPAVPHEIAAAQIKAREMIASVESAAPGPEIEVVEADPWLKSLTRVLGFE